MSADRSRLIGLLGAGISGSFSPALHEAEARAQGIALVYRILDREQTPGLGDGWPETLRRAAEFGYDGLNVTVPAKQAVLEAIDDLDDDAAALGAVNTVVFDGGRAVGCNTDWTGFLEGLRRTVPAADLDHVVLVGAGGAGSAVAYALLREGAAALTIADLDEGRAGELAHRLRPHAPAADVRVVPLGEVPAVLASATGLVNTTPVGMVGHAPGSPVPLDALHARLWVGDAVYRPRETPLIRRARDLGCPTADGGGMIVGQAVASFRHFTGASADAARMLAHLDALTA